MSYGAGLPSFESNDNPLGYKFSWSPKGVILAAKTPAVYLKGGERVTIECLAERLDSRLDATLALYDPSGREVRRVRDSHGRDPVLAFTAPADGEYVLAVYDFLYRGGNDYFYRVSLHHGPNLVYAFPPCVVVRTFSRNRVDQITWPATRILPNTRGIAAPSVDACTLSDFTRPTSTGAEPVPRIA